MAGNRILIYVPTFAEAGKRLEVWEAPGLNIARNYFTASANMRAEIYFFLVSFANYLKSLDRLGTKFELEKFEETRKLIRALRNVYEHWDKHEVNDWNNGTLNPESLRNYQAFIEKFPNSPNIAFWFIDTPDMDLSIASTISVRKTLELVSKNEVVLNKILDSSNSEINLIF